MRLREYQAVLEECCEKLLLYKPTQKSVSGSAQIALVSFNESMKCVSLVNNLELFTKLTKKILSDFDYLLTTINAEVLMNINTFREFDKKMRELSEQVQIFKETIDKILPKEDKCSVNFKLPPNLKTIKDINKFTQDLEDSLMFLQKLKIEPKFKGFDTGSEWMQFIIDSCPAIEFIFELLVGFMVTAKLYLETDKSWDERIEKQRKKKIAKEQIKFLEDLKKEELSNYEEKETSIIKDVMEKTKIGLNTKEEVNEFINAVRLSMRKMAKLMLEGMEIHPAIKAPEEVKLISNDLQKQITAYQQVYISVEDTKLVETKKKNKKNPITEAIEKLEDDGEADLSTT